MANVVFDPLEALQDGLDVMQSSWFQLWVGTWPSAIDWTAAVIDTHLVSSLSTLSKALESGSEVDDRRDVENDLNHYFSQNVRAVILLNSSHSEALSPVIRMRSIERESISGHRIQLPSRALPQLALPHSINFDTIR